MMRRIGGTAAACALTAVLLLSAVPAHATTIDPTPHSDPTVSAVQEDPAPVEPAPVEPAPIEPAPADTAPVDVDPVDTVPVDADPADALVSVSPGNQRFSGADRYEVALAVSRAWSDADTVFVAKGTDYPDALSASAVAAHLDAPLLLTPSDRLLPTVAARIQELAPSRVIIVGGPASVQPRVADALATLAPTVERVSGSDRYEVSRNLIRFAFPTAAALSTIYLATGNNFPDALSASPAAVYQGGAVLLVNGWSDGLDAASAAEIARLAPYQAVIVGGTASVNTSVEGGVRSIVDSVVRIGGADRYEASANVNLFAFPSAERIFFATGQTFADALSGGVLAGRMNSPLLVVAGSCVTDVTAWTVNNRFASAARTLLGGPNSVGDGVYRLSVCAPPPPPPTPPTPPTPPSPPSPPANPGDSKNCSDFANWAQAKAWFDTYFPYYGDIARLDQNNDGIPCESLPGAPR